MRAWSRPSSIRTSPTACSTSALVMDGTRPLALDDTGHGDDLVATHDQGPALTVGTGDFGVDEHVLDLLRAAGEPVAVAPPSYLKPWQLRFDAPAAPAHLALEIDGRGLEPDTVMLAHRLHPPAEVDAPRRDRRAEQLRELGCERPPL